MSNQGTVPVARVAEPYVALDDASVANHIARQYEMAGLDPRAAFDSPEEAFKDFGM